MRGKRAAQEAFSPWGERRNSSAHGGSHELLGRKSKLRASGRLAAHKGFVRDKGDRAGDPAICVRNVLDIDVMRSGPVRTVGRDIGLMRTERKPADAIDGGTTGAPTAASDEDHQRGRIDDTGDASAGYPPPAVIAISPSAIVERRKSPGSVVDPGPPPGVDPRPVPEVIGSPFGDDDRRRPDRPQILVVAPASIPVKVFDAAHLITRHVLGRGDAVLFLISCPAPLVPGIQRGSGRNLIRRGVKTGDFSRLPRPHRKHRASCSHFDLTGAYRDGGVSALLNIHSVGAGAKKRKACIGRIDFELFIRVQVAEAKVQRTSREADLDCLVVQVQEGNLGV
jgi:hypothetical protein